MRSSERRQSQNVSSSSEFKSNLYKSATSLSKQSSSFGIYTDDSKGSNVKGVKRIKLILEKGKQYEARKHQMVQAKDMKADPECTFKPKINSAKAPQKCPNIWV